MRLSIICISAILISSFTGHNLNAAQTQAKVALFTNVILGTKITASSTRWKMFTQWLNEKKEGVSSIFNNLMTKNFFPRSSKPVAKKDKLVGRKVQAYEQQPLQAEVAEEEIVFPQDINLGVDIKLQKDTPVKPFGATLEYAQEDEKPFLLSLVNEGFLDFAFVYLKGLHKAIKDENKESIKLYLKFLFNNYRDGLEKALKTEAVINKAVSLKRSDQMGEARKQVVSDTINQINEWLNNNKSFEVEVTLNIENLLVEYRDKLNKPLVQKTSIESTAAYLLTTKDYISESYSAASQAKRKEKAAKIFKEGLQSFLKCGENAYKLFNFLKNYSSVLDEIAKFEIQVIKAFYNDPNIPDQIQNIKSIQNVNPGASNAVSRYKPIINSFFAEAFKNFSAFVSHECQELKRQLTARDPKTNTDELTWTAELIKVFSDVKLKMPDLENKLRSAIKNTSLLKVMFESINGSPEANKDIDSNVKYGEFVIGNSDFALLVTEFIRTCLIDSMNPEAKNQKQLVIFGDSSSPEYSLPVKILENNLHELGKYLASPIPSRISENVFQQTTSDLEFLEFENNVPKLNVKSISYPCFIKQLQDFIDNKKTIESKPDKEAFVRRVHTHYFEFLKEVNKLYINILVQAVADGKDFEIRTDDPRTKFTSISGWIENLKKNFDHNTFKMSDVTQHKRAELEKFINSYSQKGNAEVEAYRDFIRAAETSASKNLASFIVSEIKFNEPLREFAKALHITDIMNRRPIDDAKILLFHERRLFWPFYAGIWKSFKNYIGL